MITELKQVDFSINFGFNLFFASSRLRVNNVSDSFFLT